MRLSSLRSSRVLISAISSLALFAGSSTAFADQHTTGVPLFSSDPGAPYTLYLDPSGFNFNGTWAGPTGSTPGDNLSINADAPSAAFSSAEVTEISQIYAAVSNEYRSFNVNVTTIDPAIAAGQAGTDTARQAYYDSQVQMMHTIMGPGGTPGWHTGADGLAIRPSIAALGSYGTHTNFMFTEAQDGNPSLANATYIGDVASHEIGHTFGLAHQSDFTGSTLVNEYTNGDTVSGPGSYVPTMGNAAGNQRVAWRVGSSDGGETTDDSGGAPVENQQNDVKTIMANPNMTYATTAIGHSFATATPVPVTAAGLVNELSPLHDGIINPVSATSPNPIGVANYTSDYFSFISNGLTAVDLTTNDGDDLLSPGTADPSISLRSTLSIFNSTDSLVGSATEAADTLSETYDSILPAGTYYAEINSFGGHNEVETSGYNAAQYYDMGGYFISGSGFGTAVPEPATLSLLAVGGLGLLRRRRVATI